MRSLQKTLIGKSSLRIGQGAGILPLVPVQFGEP
jgi:hypothetical protein